MTNSAGALGPSFAGSDRSAGQAAPWRWRLEDAKGDEVGSEHASATFPSQSDAESWVGELWRELAEEGVDAVTLFEGERRVYGPMSLHASA